MIAIVNLIILTVLGGFLVLATREEVQEKWNDYAGFYFLAVGIANLAMAMYYAQP